jgi:hypothetical protein
VRRLVLVSALVLGLPALAESSEEGRLVASRFGPKAFFVGAQGSYVTGTNQALLGGPTFTQLFAGARAEVGYDFLRTSYGSLIGIEGGAFLGAGQAARLSSGDFVTAERERLPEPSWALHLELDARGKVSPLHLGDSELGLRLSLIGGVGLELSGARFEGGSAAFTLGSELLLSLEHVSLTVTWVWRPAQGETFQIAQHTLTAHVLLGPVILGAQGLLRTAVAKDVEGIDSGAVVDARGLSAVIGLAL